MKNIPNQITVGRILLIFVFVILANFNSDTADNSLYIHVSAETARVLHAIAYVLAILGGLSDLLDGYLARKFHWESDFGRLIDPLADKIFMVATFSMMLSYDYIPAWVLIVILTREFMVTGLRTLATAKGFVIAADRWGKLKTLSQMLTLLVCGASWISFCGMPDIREPGTLNLCWNILLYLVAFVTIASGLGYFIKHKDCYMKSMFEA